ncbi:hypothetical protein PY650_35720 [Rhizobium calliandrae]|uniref:Twin-arginine translocation pathway signal n=1 Tax=Rhizobium calliandrae TaxID=1312182 RepID=A0ABT7KQ73_9HYPH|nr:hypothetical protein [Rhizobium calliandrae]MDL2410799.1 hypothetical protein [Rhizobium calliandrae]
MKTKIQVNGKALPIDSGLEMTRRRFFGGLAVATALSGAATAQAAGSRSIMENSELLAMGQRFDAAHETFRATVEQLPDKQAAYRVLAPSIPPELIVTRLYTDKWQLSESVVDEADPCCGRIKGNDGLPLLVVASYRIESRYRSGGEPVDMSEASGYHLWLYDIAKKFEAEKAAALLISGLDKVLSAYGCAETSLREAIHDLCAIRARTPAGVALKIRATAAYAALGTEERTTASQWLARAVWEDMSEEA